MVGKVLFFDTSEVYHGIPCLNGNFRILKWRDVNVPYCWHEF